MLPSSHCQPSFCLRLTLDLGFSAFPDDLRATSAQVVLAFQDGEDLLEKSVELAGGELVVSSFNFHQVTSIYFCVL